MKPIIRIAKASLIVWGGLCFIGVLAVAGFAIYKISVGNRDKVDLASSGDVRFVLNLVRTGRQEDREGSTQLCVLPLANGGSS